MPEEMEKRAVVETETEKRASKEYIRKLEKLTAKEKATVKKMLRKRVEKDGEEEG